MFAGFARVFDIVNGFLIDAVAVLYCYAWLWLRVRGAISSQINLYDYLAEIIPSASLQGDKCYTGLSLMVRILKREVRAFGGCLGMYRRRRTWHAAISVGEL